MKAKIRFISRFLSSILLKNLFFRKKRFVYVALGDSAVEGVGASSPHKSYPSVVFLAIKKELSHATHYNFGKSGAKVSDVLKNQIEKAVVLKPDVITLSVGFNDVAQKTKTTDFEKDFSQIMSILKKTHALVVVNNIPDISLASSIPFYKKVYGQILIKRFNKRIKKHVDSTGFLLIDLYSQSRLLRGHSGLVSEDGLHPSDLGHAIWGNTIISHMLHIITKYKKNNSFGSLAI